jgi:hypothetical protein
LGGINFVIVPYEERDLFTSARLIMDMDASSTLAWKSVTRNLFNAGTLLPF